MEEYRIELKIKNNLILSKIESLGYKNPRNFCEENDYPYDTLMNIANMKQPVLDRRLKIRTSVLKLCDILNCIPEEIFSAAQMEMELKTNKKTLKVNEAEMKFLTNQFNSQKLLEDSYLEDQFKVNIENVLETLTPREQKVIEMRMGLGEYSNQMTLEECANELSITSGERVRQIESKALRKLRHPSRAEKLRDFIKE